MNNGLSVLLTVLLIGVAVLLIIAWCKIFKKAGVHPGKFFIPVYGQYLQYDIADSKGIFFGTIALSVIYSIVTAIIAGSAASRSSYYYYSYSSYQGMGTALTIITIIFMVIAFIMQCVFCTRLAQNFGKSGGFAVGLIFLYPIFLCILGFGSAQYCGAGGGYYGYAKSTSAPDWTCPQCRAVNPAHCGVCSVCGTQKR